MSEAFDAGYTQYQVNRSALRKLVRRIYLWSARSKLPGRVLDFGCGIGELLETLPSGSMGLEYNGATVAYCRTKGLDVTWYDGYLDGWALTGVAEGRQFESMVISHVLEHLDAPEQVLRALLLAAERLGIRRVLVVVPGKAGYRTDATHRTFVDAGMLAAPSSVAGTAFTATSIRYFPGNRRALGDWFPHHELQVLFRRRCGGKEPGPLDGTQPTKSD